MKKKLLLFLILLTNTISAQNKIMTSTGIITFEASVPFFEAVEAKNDKLYCILNVKRGTVSFMTFIKHFSFERALMEEHFNENYMESDRYPKATFKGSIEKFDMDRITTKSQDFYIKGRIYIHGKSKNIRVLARIKKVKNGIELKSNFSINTEHFNIKIPYIIRSKISKKVNIEVYSLLE